MVVSGIESGDRVIVFPSFLVVDGARVKESASKSHCKDTPGALSAGRFPR